MEDFKVLHRRPQTMLKVLQEFNESAEAFCAVSDAQMEVYMESVSVRLNT